METQRTLLVLIALLTAIMILRAVVAATNGNFGTVGRQIGVGSVILAFGVGLVRYWDRIGD
jgi:hypothetical protein